MGGISVMSLQIADNIYKFATLGRECGWVEQVMAQFLAESMVVLLLGAEVWIICYYKRNIDVVSWYAIPLFSTIFEEKPPSHIDSAIYHAYLHNSSPKKPRASEKCYVEHSIDESSGREWI
jgi:hypothetical protein